MQTEKVLQRMREAGLTVAAAESCTGGLIAALLTSIAGSSDVFDRGFVTYSDAAKRELLGVPQETLGAHGAVSAPVAAAMAMGALRNSAADRSVAVTGIAGPGGGSAEKPVGLVFVAVADRRLDAPHVRELRLPDNGRDGIRNETARIALQMLADFDAGVEPEG